MRTSDLERRLERRGLLATFRELEDGRRSVFNTGVYQAELAQQGLALGYRAASGAIDLAESLWDERLIRQLVHLPCTELVDVATAVGLVLGNEQLQSIDAMTASAHQFISEIPMPWARVPA